MHIFFPKGKLLQEMKIWNGGPVEERCLTFCFSPWPPKPFPPWTVLTGAGGSGSFMMRERETCCVCPVAFGEGFFFPQGLLNSTPLAWEDREEYSSFSFSVSGSTFHHCAGPSNCSVKWRQFQVLHVIVMERKRRSGDLGAKASLN